MPFPLAHPAAVLPLRRFCPRHLCFPALIIGSLTPDIGYAFGRLKLENFSHRPIVGTFGFCLPVGLVLMLGFYLVRLPVARRLPARLERIFLPLCQQPAASPLPIAVSLTLGALSHQMLDALTHPEDWLVHYLPGLLTRIPVFGLPHLLLCDVLYAGCTFGGVAWLALAYLSWWEKNADTSISRGMQWFAALLLASAMLLLALVSRNYNSKISLCLTGIFSALLVTGFLLATGWRFSRPESWKDKPNGV